MCAGRGRVVRAVGRSRGGMRGRPFFFGVRRRRGRVVTALPMERQEHQPEHVGGGQQRGQDPDRPEHGVAAR